MRAPSPVVATTPPRGRGLCTTLISHGCARARECARLRVIFRDSEAPAPLVALYLYSSSVRRSSRPRRGHGRWPRGATRYCLSSELQIFGSVSRSVFLFLVRHSRIGISYALYSSSASSSLATLNPSPRSYSLPYPAAPLAAIGQEITGSPFAWSGPAARTKPGPAARTKPRNDGGAVRPAREVVIERIIGIPN